jgi:hypothetical protein
MSENARLGHFTVTDEFVTNCPHLWAEIEKLCTFKESHRSDTKRMTFYVAECRYFEPVAPGESVPHYTWLVEREEMRSEVHERLYVGRGEHPAAVVVHKPLRIASME